MKLHSRMLVVLTLVASTVSAQTKVTPPKNKYTPEQDVQIGKEAAAEVRQQYPLINDSQIKGYLERMGDQSAGTDRVQHRVRLWREFCAHYKVAVRIVNLLNPQALHGGLQSGQTRPAPLS